MRKVFFIIMLLVSPHLIAAPEIKTKSEDYIEWLSSQYGLFGYVQGELYKEYRSNVDILRDLSSKRTLILSKSNHLKSLWNNSENRSKNKVIRNNSIYNIKYSKMYCDNYVKYNRPEGRCLKQKR